jgi:1,2-diacylglycerol-3-alpha-glucose alpha-1,2-glucosyltransferase
MKACLYGELKSLLKGSGIGTAIEHQIKALELNGVEVTKSHKDKFDVIDINTIGPRSAYVAHKIKWKNIPVAIHAHTTVEDMIDSFTYSTKLAPKIKGYLKYFYEQADTIIAPTKYTKDVLTSYGIKKDIQVISNGVDIDKFKPESGEYMSFREKYGLEDLVPFCVGHVFKRKGVLDYIELASQFPKTKFMWIGRTYDNLVDKETREAMGKKPPNLHFTGYVADVTAAYCGCDIFLFPSHCENQGIAILEAAACEKPMIVRDLPTYEGWLIHEKNCLKAKDNKEFNKYLTTLMEDSLLRKRLAKNAHKMAQKHSLKNVGEKLKKAYESTK